MISFKSFKDMNTSECIKKLNQEGHYCFENLLNDTELNTLTKLVESKLKENNNKYFFLADNKLNETFINNKEFLSKFENLFRELSINLKINDFEKQNIYKVLRVVTGKKNEKESYRYHFDAHLFTLLIPIIIPSRKDSNNGDLIIFPNIRKVGKSLILNILQKLIFQNRITKLLLKNNCIFKNKSMLLKLKPGNVYIFYGYRTLHGNQTINPNDVRATILLHFYDIFKNSKLVKFNRKLRLRNEGKIIKENKKNHFR